MIDILSILIMKKFILRRRILRSKIVKRELLLRKQEILMIDANFIMTLSLLLKMYFFFEII